MNFGLLFGVAIAICIVWFGAINPAARPSLFLDHHAMILVLGGTLGAALIGHPLRQFRELLSFFFMGMIFPSKRKDVKIIEQILILSGRPDLASLDRQIIRELHPFLMEGYLLLQRPDFSTAEFKLVVHSRRLRFKERYAEDAKLLTAVAKFPPAFGLMGATTGMIAMMSGLGDGGKDTIGPAMAVALVATFWGIALANFVLLPMADRANRLNSQDAKHRLMIATGLILIHAQAKPAVIFEHLLGFVPVAERGQPRLGQAIALADRRLQRGAVRIIGDSEAKSRSSDAV